MSAVRRRPAWTTTPASAPAELDPGEVDGLAVHWLGPPAPAAVLAARPASVASYLEGVRRFHVYSKGWADIAYQWAVDQAGTRWELRGWQLRSAANGDTGPNRRYGAIVCLLGVGQQPSPAMLAGLADAVDDFRGHFPKARQLRTHNDVRPEPTACPGPDLTRWVRQHAGAAGTTTTTGGDVTPKDVEQIVDGLLKADRVPVDDTGNTWTVTHVLGYLTRRAREQNAQLAAQGKALNTLAGLLAKGDGVTPDQLRTVLREELADAVVQVDVSVAGPGL